MTKFDDLANIVDRFVKMNVGYDQAQRWTYLNVGSRSMVNNSECDCSASTIGMIWLAGYAIPNVNVGGRGECWTGNADALLLGAGFKKTVTAGWSISRIEAATGTNTVILGDGHIMIKHRSGLWCSANQDENGNIRGGRAGDQTGNETNLRPLWARHGGWLAVYTPPDAPGTRPGSSSAVVSGPNDGTLHVGSTGESVRKLQAGLLRQFPAYATPIKLNGGADGNFGAATDKVVREFQRRSGLVADGIVGTATKAALAKVGVSL